MQTQQKLTADDYLESEAKAVQRKLDSKKKPAMIKKPVHHFDSADYEKDRQAHTATEQLANK